MTTAVTEANNTAVAATSFARPTQSFSSNVTASPSHSTAVFIASVAQTSPMAKTSSIHSNRVI